MLIFGEVDANLVSKIAGEDLVNDRMKVSSEVAAGVVQTNGIGVAVNNTTVIDPIDFSNVRWYSIIAIGYGGNIKLHLDISPDNGGNWIGGMPAGDPTGQYIYVPPTQILVGRGRLTVTNIAAAAQNYNVWMTLGR